MIRSNLTRALQWYKRDELEFMHVGAPNTWRSAGVTRHVARLLAVSGVTAVVASAAFLYSVENSPSMRSRRKDEKRLAKNKQSAMWLFGSFVAINVGILAVWRHAIRTRNVTTYIDMAHYFSTHPISSPTSGILGSISHATVSHLSLNMFCLGMFGSDCLAMGLSPVEMSLVFASGAVVGDIAYLLERTVVRPDNGKWHTKGASGGVCGMAGAVIVADCTSLGTVQYVPVACALWSAFVGYEMYHMIRGTYDSTAHSAHIGGLLVGSLLGSFYLFHC